MLEHAMPVSMIDTSRTPPLPHGGDSCEEVRPSSSGGKLCGFETIEEINGLVHSIRSNLATDAFELNVSTLPMPPDVSFSYELDTKKALRTISGQFKWCRNQLDKHVKEMDRVIESLALDNGSVDRNVSTGRVVKISAPPIPHLVSYQLESSTRDDLRESRNSGDTQEDKGFYSSNVARPSHASVQAFELLPEFMQDSEKRQDRDVLEHVKAQARKRKSQRNKSWHDDDAPWHSASYVRELLSGRTFEGLVTVLILSNASITGWQADWGVKHAEEDTPTYFHIVNAAFTACFSFELSIRIYAFRGDFFYPHGKDFGWNVFDTVMVALGVIDVVMQIFASSVVKLSFIRFLRVMRLVRVVRLIRVVRFFHDLRIMVHGIMGATKSLFWACGLLFMIVFMASICFIQLIAEYLPSLDATTRNDTLSHFGSLTQTVYSLYLSITGGISWHEVARPLFKLHTILVVLYSGYIAFTVLCVLNIITGVFVENAANLSQTDEEQLLIESLESRMKWFDQVRELFDKQTDGKGVLDFEGFKEHVDNIEIQAYFRKLGIDIHSISIKGLFQLLDFDQKGLVEFDEFVLGLQMLHGNAKAIDLARIRHELKVLRKDIKETKRVLNRSSDAAFGYRCS